jgi:hypothetical protein
VGASFVWRMFVVASFVLCLCHWCLSQNVQSHTFPVHCWTNHHTSHTTTPHHHTNTTTYQDLKYHHDAHTNVVPPKVSLFYLTLHQHTCPSMAQTDRMLMHYTRWSTLEIHSRTANSITSCIYG